MFNQVDGKMGNCLAQAGRSLAGRRGSDGRAFSVRAQNNGVKATLREGRSVATTNPFWDRLAAHQTYSSGEDAPIRQKESEISKEEVQRFIEKLRWDEQEVLLQELSREGRKKESDANF